jgi:hypothetical protein
MRKPIIATALSLALLIAATSLASSDPQTRRAKQKTETYEGHVIGDRQAEVRFDVRYDPNWKRGDDGYRGFHTVLSFTATNVRFRCADGTAFRAEPQWDVGKVRIPILRNGRWAAYAEETRTRDAVLERYALRGAHASERVIGLAWDGWFRAAESKDGLGIDADGCRTGRVEWKALINDRPPLGP